MSKLFRYMPPVFEAYNPDDTFADLTFDYVTRNKKGYLHSFNDEPSSVANTVKKEEKTMTWHSNGKVHRENESPHINLSPTRFLTHDSQGLKHSFNGMPGKTTSGELMTWLEWYDHGGLHREGDLPALLCANQDKILEYSYFEHDLLHRANNQPADVSVFSEAWYVKGWQHNAKGHSYINNEENSYSYLKNSETWHLYDVELTAETFEAIKNFEAEQMVPLWVAFLYKLEIIHDEEISLFLDEANSWDTTFPVKWVLKSWGVNEDDFQIQVRNLYRREELDIYGRIHFEALQQIIEFEKENEA